MESPFEPVYVTRLRARLKLLHDDFYRRWPTPDPTDYEFQRAIGRMEAFEDCIEMMTNDEPTTRLLATPSNPFPHLAP